MSRLSREKKREQKQAARAATPAAPIDVHVPGASAEPDRGQERGPGPRRVREPERRACPTARRSAASRSSRPPARRSSKAVLNRLHHIALATGHSVLATIHDERIGYVVPLQVDPDGSSHFTAEPVRTAPPQDAVAGRPAEPPAAGAVPEPPTAGAVTEPPVPAPGPMPPVAEPEPPRSDSATHVLRPVPESDGRGATPTFPLRAVPEPEPAPEPVPTFELRAVQEPPQPTPEDTPPGPAMPPGIVAPPTGEFGPPPPMDARPLPLPETGPSAEPRRSRKPDPVLEAELLADLDAKPTPARGFDAVAEAMFGDEAPGAPGDSAVAALVAEPITRINEAVKEGRIDAAAGLADQTVAQASATLGPEHPEVLRLGELSAYIAYLAGDPLRAFHLSLDLAGARRRTGDAEAAYGDVQSAATAWRAVRDPALGLELGRDLIGLWTELAAEDGPAAEEIEQLESARARMGRLTERARNQ